MQIPIHYFTFISVLDTCSLYSESFLTSPNQLSHQTPTVILGGENIRTSPAHPPTNPFSSSFAFSRASCASTQSSWRHCTVPASKKHSKGGRGCRSLKRTRKHSWQPRVTGRRSRKVGKGGGGSVRREQNRNRADRILAAAAAGDRGMEVPSSRYLTLLYSSR